MDKTFSAKATLTKNGSDNKIFGYIYIKIT